MSKRLRPVHFIIQPVFMIDDGDSLTPFQPQPMIVPAAEWNAGVLDKVAEAIAALRYEVEKDDESV